MINNNDTINSLFDFENIEQYVELPGHIFDIATHTCIYCGEDPLWDSYEAYVEHFYTFEYEGDRWHAPQEQGHWEFLSSTCNKTA